MPYSRPWAGGDVPGCQRAPCWSWRARAAAADRLARPCGWMRPGRRRAAVVAAPGARHQPGHRLQPARGGFHRPAAGADRRVRPGVGDAVAPAAGHGQRPNRAAGRLGRPAVHLGCNLYYPGAGHYYFGFPPYFAFFTGEELGGSVQANALATEQFWSRMIIFLNNLAARQPRPSLSSDPTPGGQIGPVAEPPGRASHSTLPASGSAARPVAVLQCCTRIKTASYKIATGR
jgi:hypothetical protein